MNFAGILAGGIGSRMESTVPKQFLSVGGVPIIIRTLHKFFENGGADKYVVAMNPQWREYFLNMLTENQIKPERLIIIDGGTSRFRSMVNITNACASDLGDSLTENDLLCVHDCARPFLSQRIISENFGFTGKYDMVTTSFPTIDTVLLAADGKESTTVPDRSTVFLDQGPQTYKIKQFLEIYKTLSEKEIDSYIEAGRMYLERGYHVGIVHGEQSNFKITTEFDKLQAELMLKENIIS